MLHNVTGRYAPYIHAKRVTKQWNVIAFEIQVYVIFNIRIYITVNCYTNYKLTQYCLTVNDLFDIIANNESQ